MSVGFGADSINVLIPTKLVADGQAQVLSRVLLFQYMAMEDARFLASSNAWHVTFMGMELHLPSGRPVGQQIQVVL